MIETVARAGQPPRRPAGGGYPTGDATRLRIIAAATDIFGKRGYVSASTREIAAQAGVRTPALQYYFDNKLGLFRSCVEAVTSLIWLRLGPYVADVEECVRAEADTDALISSYCRLQDAMIDSFFSRNEGYAVRLLITANTLPETADVRMLLHDRVSQPLFRAKSAIVGRLTGKAIDGAETYLNTFAVSGVFMNFYLNQERVFKTLGWEMSDESNTETLKPLLRRHATILLTGLARAREAHDETAYPAQAVFSAHAASCGPER